MAELNFSGANQEAMDDFGVVPAGLYNAQIVKTEIKPTKDKEGSLLKAQYKIIDGEFKRAYNFGQYNLTNPSAEAVNISKKQIKTLCDAVGKPDGFSDTNELHNIPMEIKVGVVPENGPYAANNDIKFYDKYKGVSEQTTAAGGEAGAGADVPWGKE